MRPPNTRGCAPSRSPDLGTASPEACFDIAHATRFLRAVYLEVPGWLNIVSTSDWRGRCFPTDEAGIIAAASYAQRLDAVRRPRGIYFRATTLRAVPTSGRGLTLHTLSVPMLWADVDYGTDGHHCSTLPSDATTAQAILTESGLPAPTLTVHSGGGLYPLWLLSERPEPGLASTLSEGVQRALAIAHERHGCTYGTGVGDLARVLRLPGSVNRKTDEPRACRVHAASGVLVNLAAFPLHPSPQRPCPRSAPPIRVGSLSGVTRGNRRGPFDVLDHYAEWSDIFTPASWTFVKTEPGGAQLWLRPGGAASEYSARCFAHNAVVHSEDAGLPTGAGHRLTKGRLFAHLWHGGNEADAARDLIAASHGHSCTPAAACLPQTVLVGICALGPSLPEGRRATGSAATMSELESWISTFTADHQPARLLRRLEWMFADPPARLATHARWLVCDSIAGHYPASSATAAMAAAHRHHGCHDADVPHRLLSIALGAVLAALQTAP